MRPLLPEQVRKNSDLGTAFPKNLLQLGYASDALGFGANHVVSGTVPIFWGGDVQAKRGVALHYHHNVFHTHKLFSLDVGASVSSWQSRRESMTFYATSVFPVLQITPIRREGTDLYLTYSLLGPTAISRARIDGNQVGRHFTFQDFIGAGVFAGRGRRLNVELRIAHYSNGNIFPDNIGVAIPLTLNLGYAFH